MLEDYSVLLVAEEMEEVEVEALVVDDVVVAEEDVVFLVVPETADLRDFYKYFPVIFCRIWLSVMPAYASSGSLGIMIWKRTCLIVSR